MCLGILTGISPPPSSKATFKDLSRSLTRSYRRKSERRNCQLRTRLCWATFLPASPYFTSTSLSDDASLRKSPPSLFYLLLWIAVTHSFFYRHGWLIFELMEGLARLWMLCARPFFVFIFLFLLFVSWLAFFWWLCSVTWWKCSIFFSFFSLLR